MNTRRRDLHRRQYGFIADFAKCILSFPSPSPPRPLYTACGCVNTDPRLTIVVECAQLKATTITHHYQQRRRHSSRRFPSLDPPGILSFSTPSLHLYSIEHSSSRFPFSFSSVLRPSSSNQRDLSKAQ